MRLAFTEFVISGMDSGSQRKERKSGMELPIRLK